MTNKPSEGTTPQAERPTLNELLESARKHVMTVEEKEAQRQSWVRGEMAMGEIERGMTSQFPPTSEAKPQLGNCEDNCANCGKPINHVGWVHLDNGQYSCNPLAADSTTAFPKSANEDATMQPTYYVRHPEDSYSEANPQPVMPRAVAPVETTAEEKGQ